ncbi:SDR family oxidoreductase [bacterium]|jgi:3-oxoacyl-[acyl-carrier protein] reductase|nr:SDR family oxidoreductase [Rhodospirillaceae bacterium]MBT6143731.1 SDR family oxidoreductase [bacterium]
MDCRMDGRTAVVTGSSMGLGFAMAKEFAKSGANVALVARRPDVLEAAKADIESVSSTKVGAYVCDVSDPGAITSMCQSVASELGPIDVLVNNAGSSIRGEFLSITDEQWRGDLELKLFGAIRLTRQVFPGMIERRWGRIINILNTGAKAPPPTGSPTVVSRAAGMALTKVLAGEGAPHNVLVNALLVGKIVSDQIARRHANLETNISLEDYIAESGEQVPMGRMGTAEEFANMACFLASDAGSYITGTAINVDGGFSPVV